MSVIKKYLLSTLWTQYGKVISCGNNENLEDGIDYNQYAPLDKILPAHERPSPAVRQQRLLKLFTIIY